MSRNASTGAYTFPASTVRPAVDGTVISSTDFNAALADLETAVSYTYGSATPTLTFGGLSTGITYSQQLYQYTIIGNLCFFHFAMTLTSKGSATGSALIVVTHPSAPASNEEVIVRQKVVDLDVASGYYGVYAAVLSTGFSLRAMGDNIGTVALTDAALTNTTNLSFQGHFRI